MIWWFKFQSWQRHIQSERPGKPAKYRSGPLVALTKRIFRRNFFDTYKDKA